MDCRCLGQRSTDQAQTLKQSSTTDHHNGDRNSRSLTPVSSDLEKVEALKTEAVPLLKA